jgi:hypothetical protein
MCYAYIVHCCNRGYEAYIVYEPFAKFKLAYSLVSATFFTICT